MTVGAQPAGMDDGSETTFTRIVAGELPSHTLYDGEATYAFLDANPVAPGHTLVVPKRPYERLQAVPADVATELFETVWALVPAVEAAVGADATTITLNNGSAAGQEVPHVHWHVVPRFDGDGTLVEYRSLLEEKPSESEMAAIAADIRERR
jgi:histidine triad (HIT) family protein